MCEEDDQIYRLGQTFAVEAGMQARSFARLPSLVHEIKHQKKRRNSERGDHAVTMSVDTPLLDQNESDDQHDRGQGIERRIDMWEMTQQTAQQVPVVPSAIQFRSRVAVVGV